MFANHAKPNYPDILGYVTGGDRFSVAPLEFALSTGRSATRAGDSFNVFVLVQNTVDVSVTMAISLNLPELPNTEGFMARTTHLHILIRPAEVGYVKLPITTAPSLPVGDYRLSVDITTEVNGKAQPIRAINKDPNLDYYFTFSEEALNHIIKLKPMTFHTGTRGIFSANLSAPLRVASAKRKTYDPPKGANWFSLWSLSDNSDVRPLLERHHKDLSTKILPLLKRERLFKPLFQATQNRFHKAGYQMQPVEAHFLTKLMVHILESAADLQTLNDYQGEEIYNVAQLLKTGWQTNGAPIRLPIWCHHYLNLLNTKPDSLDNPLLTLSTVLYDELLRDAINHGFRMIEAFNHEALGTREEIENYGKQIIQMLWNPEVHLSFVDIYLPLVVGGILINESVLLPHEQILTELNTLADVSVRETRSEANIDDDSFHMIDSLIGAALAKYGYHR